MNFLDFWKKSIKRNSLGQDAHDVTYPESKGMISIEAIQKQLAKVDDAQFIDFYLPNDERVTLINIKTLVNSATLHRLVLEPLNLYGERQPEDLLKTAHVVPKNELPMLLHQIVCGFTVLFFHDQDLILAIDTYSPPQRSISSPENETTVIGPQDSFTESLETNISLLRKRIRSIHLKTKMFTIGTESKNSVCVIYLENIANEENVQRIFHRLHNVDYDGFTGLPFLTQIIEDKPYSPFPQFIITARPDYTTQHLLDGRIAVIMNGSPDAVISPSTFLEMFMSVEDLYNRWSTATMLRLIRFFGFFVTIFLTSTYVSVLTFHPEMLPPALLTLLSESRSKVPFPPLIEVLLMELFIEILREAGARMPTKIGQTLGIVGGIVIGTAAVEAGLASNILIVVVSVSALLSFLPTNFLMSSASRFMRYIFIIMAGIFGMYGQAIALAWMSAHLSNITSLGSPYMNPFPRKFSDLANFIFRAPVPFLLSRSGMSRAKKELKVPPKEE